MTEYVVTRWYRAPELLLAGDEYSAAIDMWSAGCLLVELYSRRPIFPGKDVKNQIEHICAICGKPSPDEMQAIQNHKARAFLATLPDTQRTDFSKILPDAPPAAIDLINRLLQFDPAKRMSAMEAISHPYCKDYRDPIAEAKVEKLTVTQLEPPSETRLGAEGIRRLMWEEILKFHPEASARETQAAKDAEKKVRYVENS